jgi:translocation and assembly module TamB
VIGKRIAWAAAALAGLLLLAAGGGVLALRSGWFHERVRARLVEVVETATGGRVGIGSFGFDWRQLRAEVRDFTLRGTEPRGKPPLLHADSIAIGVKIVSIFKREADIAYLDVAEPRVYLIVDPEGRTNIPEPRVHRQGGPNTAEAIMRLAIGRFSLNRGLFEVESRGATPFDARGRNLGAALSYERAGENGGPDYRGSLSVKPLEFRWGNGAVVPVEVRAAVTMAPNRIGVIAADLATGDSRVSFSGAIENLAAPRGSFQYRARVAAADVARLAPAPELKAGWAEIAGEASWPGGGGYSARGKLHVYDLEYRDSTVRIRNARSDGSLIAGPEAIELDDARVSGDVTGVARVEGRVAKAVLRGGNLDLAGIALAGLGGSFTGRGRSVRFDRYMVDGEVAGLLASGLVATYSPAALPWDGRVSGAVRLEGSFRRKEELHVAASLAVTPEAGRPAVRGLLDGSWDARSGILDLGQSTLSLPSSRLEFSGAIGRQLRVRLETRDLNDLLPAVGIDAASAPVKLESGTAHFEGTVTGNLARPSIAGRLSVAHFACAGTRFDSLAADAAVSPDHVSLRNASLARGTLRAGFQAEMALDNWRTGEGSQIFGNATLRGAPVGDLAELAGAVRLPLSGMLGATARISGTLGNPLLDADLDIAGGAIEGEPFDRFSGRLNATKRRVELAEGQLAAGAKLVRLTAVYDRSPSGWDSGRLRFQVSTNAMPLDQIETLVKARPGIGGAVEATAQGAFDLAPSSGGRLGFRIGELHADLAAHGLQLNGQRVGAARITANSDGPALRVHLDSDFAGSTIRGDGQWRLEGDYPGSATVTFSKVDLAQLEKWSVPAASKAPSNFAGSAQGELRIDGPALRPREIKAELRLPAFEIGPAPGQGVPAGITLRNSGPVVVTLAHSVVTVESARLVGPSTDLRLSGKVLTEPKIALDLRASGRLDLAIVGTFTHDVTASGELIADATARGSSDAPQINGRIEMQKASFNVTDVPNGLSNANGTILFSGGRATIQNLEGESGGGRIALSGFANYEGGELVFRLRARASEVRVRYPEGVSTVANATLNLTGTSGRSMLAGSVTILRTGFNPQSDFSSVLAKSAEPVRTPSAKTGMLGGMNFDIQIDTAPDIQVQSSLTQDVGVEANLRMRGTFSNPALLGRINITQGQLVFFGTKYSINQGSISFYNPVRVEPVLNIDLETKARGVEVTLNVSGPLNKLNLTPRSDPPLQFNEIVALLATGQAPTSDPAQLAQQTGSPQPWQQAGASALLGQAIASPVAGRLQRFFGVSRLRIDPTLPGVEYNPQARITVEQQVTPDITFTYITVVTSSNPQVVSVEWDLSRQWSAVAVREENGLFGLDFFYRRRFK